MVNKPVKDAVGTPSKKKFFSSSKFGKSNETLKTSRLQTSGDKDEASKYPVIYYRGENMKRDFSKMLNLRQTSSKDSKDTAYQEVPHDHIAYRYECIRSLGKGSFGNVILAIDHKEKIEVAVKVVRRDIRFTTQAKEEIAILEALRRLNPNPNGSSDRFPIVQLIEHFMFRDHMCLSFELLGCSLYDLIKDKKDQGLPRDRVRRLMSSVLDGLNYVWNAGIIHCDLKPENVLLVSKASDGGPNDIRDLVKIIDFGSSCFMGKQCYPYIQSRFYRAPEVILRLEYNRPIDIWSFGCLIFEMIRGYPLFPGEDEFDQLACMMEKLGMPPWQMIEGSRVFSRYFAVSEGTWKYYNPLDKQTPLRFIPKYCTIHQNPDGTAELRSNLSRKTHRLRKAPGAVQISQALVSTLSHSSGKYNDYTPTSSEELDNMHVVELIKACLAWQPERRITPSEAKTFSWFTYKTNQPGDNLSKTLLSRSRSPASSKHSSSSSYHTLHTDITPAAFKNMLTNGNLPHAIPAQAAVVSSAAPVADVRIPSPPKVASLAQAHSNNCNKHIDSTSDYDNNVTASNNKNTVNSKVKISVTSISPPGPEILKRHGSLASISSGENKQEERVIYARAYKPFSPKSTSFEYNAGAYRQSNNSTEKKMPDIAYPSLDSSIDEIAPRLQENARYTRKNGAQVNERYLETSTRLRKRNQSQEPKRHTQPVGTEVVTKDKSILPSRSYITSLTTALSSSPEDGSEKSGRHNPHALSKTSQWDLSTIDRSESKPNYISSDGDAARARKGITLRSESLAFGRNKNLAKTRSAVDFPINLSLDNLNESERLRRRPVYEDSLRVEPMRRPVGKEQILAFKPADTGISISPKQHLKANTAKNYGARDTSGRIMQAHGDHRRRRLTNKFSSANHLVELTEAKLSSSRSSNTTSIPRIHNTRTNGAGVDTDNGFMDLNKSQPSIMMVKPQT